MTVIGILTAGGDCPGLNAVIRATTAGSWPGGDTMVGFLNGWEGADGGRRHAPRPGCGARHPRSRRHHPRHLAQRSLRPRRRTRLRAPTLRKHDLDVRGRSRRRRHPAQRALRLADEGLAVVGVPKTIDNDIAATDFTFGFDTAVQIATDAIDRLTTTAEAHNRVILVEVMGRTQGWIATLRRPRRRRRRHPHPRTARCLWRRWPRSSPPPSPPATTTRSSSWRRASRHPMPRPAPQGRLRLRPTRRGRLPDRAGARGAHRVRDPGDRARPPAAGRHPHRLRPGAGHPARDRRRRPRPGRHEGNHGRGAGYRHRRRAARRRRADRSAASTRLSSKWPVPSSAERANRSRAHHGAGRVAPPADRPSAGPRPAQRGHDRHQIIGQGTRGFDRVAGDRVHELEVMGVEEHPGAALPAAVGPIPRHRQTDGAQMHPDLVGPPGVQRHLEQGESRPGRGRPDSATEPAGPTDRPASGSAGRGHARWRPRSCPSSPEGFRAPDTGSVGRSPAAGSPGEGRRRPPGRAPPPADRRCPGRGGGRSPSGRPPRRRARPATGRRMPAANVPVARPAPGCTTTPAGLSTTARWASS